VVIEVEAAEEAVIRPGVKISVGNVEDRDTGPEIARIEHHRNNRQHHQLQQQLSPWITRLSGVGSERNSGMNQSAVCWTLESKRQ